MTEHLPIQRWTKVFTRYPASEVLPNENGEYVTYDDHLAALRACEERVSGEFLTSAALAVTGMSDPRYAKGYTAALDAAREAVAPMEAVVLLIAATLVRHPSEDDLHDGLQRHWCGEWKAALFQYRAAIDALKESND